MVEHRQLLQAVAELTVMTGFNATTVSGICDLADVSRRTFYYHFSGVAEAFAEAYGDVDAGMRTAVSDAAPRAAATPDERVIRCVTALVGFVGEHPVAADLWFVESLSAGPQVAELRAATIRWLATQVIAEDAALSTDDRWGALALAGEIAIGGLIGIVGDAIRRGTSTELRGAVPELAAAASRVLGLAFVPRLD